MIHARVGQSNLIFSLMFFNVQFYANKHKFLEAMFSIELKY
jgi:hypothetical protein